MIRKVLAAAMPMALMACASAGEVPADKPATANLALADGTAAGTARLVGNGDRLSLVVDVAGISPGPHGIHLHTVGQCEAPGFTSAGGHLNPGGKQHGTDNPLGSHLGDLPNIQVDAEGKGSLTVPLHGARADLMSELFDADGTAIVVHAGPDDYKTDPAGNSGGRIACGVFTRG